MASRKYVTYRQIEQILEENYNCRTPLTIPELYDLLQDIASELPPPQPSADPPWGLCSDLDFQERMDMLPMILQEPVTERRQSRPLIREHAVFATRPDHYNMMIHRQYNFLRETEHMHDYIEVYYILRGSCSMHFPGKTVSLHTGDMIFLAPNAKHYLESYEKDNFILDLSVRGSSFEGLFMKQLSCDSILSAFFRKAFYDKADLNYILFHTHGDPGIKHALKNIAMETSIRDPFNDIVYTSWTNIVFSILLRKFCEDVEADPPLENNDFTRILAYISEHYDTVSLDELAVRFRYSKPHICNLIKNNTGRTLTALVNAQKLTRAEAFLEMTDCSIGEIAGILGFSSSDYFTRLFRRTYGVTPCQFRRSRQTSGRPGQQ